MDEFDVISEKDEMFQGNKDHYFSVGASALFCINQALTAVKRDIEDIKRILDIPCGHGRVLRTLKKTFTNAEITACDIIADAVDFCANTFGAVPVYSSNDVTGKYDLIWCGSLLTHLPLNEWFYFMNFFNDHLKNEGIVVFTTHGRWPAKRIGTGDCLYGLTESRQIIGDYKKNGFGFFPYQWAMEKKHYGISITRPSKAIEIFEEIQGLHLISYQERGWDNHQDVIAAIKK
jgi:SAM-dependent methyltransferase